MNECQLIHYDTTSQAELMNFFVGLWRGDQNQAEKLMGHVRRNSSIVVAKVDNKVIGYRNVYKDSMLTVHFHQAAVLHEYRKQGIFTALLDSVIDQFGNRAITADISRNAHHLETMERVGFQVERELPGWQYRIKRPGRSLFRLPTSSKLNN